MPVPSPRGRPAGVAPVDLARRLPPFPRLFLGSLLSLRRFIFICARVIRAGPLTCVKPWGGSNFIQAPAITTNTGHQLFHSSARTVNKAIDSARESAKFTLRNRPGEFPPGDRGSFPPASSLGKRGIRKSRRDSREQMTCKRVGDERQRGSEKEAFRYRHNYKSAIQS